VLRSPRGRLIERNSSAIDDTITAVIDDPHSDNKEGCDEYLRWHNFEPEWSKTVFERPGSNLIAY
jgi:hypothetical protein